MNLTMRFLLLTMLTTVVGCSTRCPSDEEIQALFNKHEASFNKLVAMASEDGEEGAIQRDGSYEKVAISSDRADEYLQLLSDIELEGAFVNWAHNGKGILLLVSPEGWIDGPILKSMRYHIVPAVHADVLGKKHTYPIFKRLGENWQLQLQNVGGAE